MPSTIIRLTGEALRERDPNRLQYVFKVPPKMTKPEIKEYLQKIYGMDVKKVNTTNYEGKWKRRNNILHKRPAYKKAIVSLNSTNGVSNLELKQES